MPVFFICKIILVLLLATLVLFSNLQDHYQRVPFLDVHSTRPSFFRTAVSDYSK